MDKQTLIQLIAASRILTDAERTYWRQTLEVMTYDQMARLEKILTKVSQLQWTKQIQKAWTSLTSLPTHA